MSLLALMGRLVVSLAVVFGLMAVAARMLKRRGLGGTRGTTATSRIEVLARQGLGRSSSVQLVRVGGKTLVLGVTDSTVSVLGEADPLLVAAELALAPDEQSAPAAPGWAGFVEVLKDRTARRA